jgi:hydroxypyruvate isomerase
MRLSLCLETVFTDRPFVERMREASTLGYSAIEFWDWRTKDLALIRETAAQLNLTIAAMSGNRQHALIDPDGRAGLMAEMGSNLEWIGYLHVADLPGRYQPGTGKIDYRGIADWLKGVRFDGFIGMEFFPQGPGHLAARAAQEIFT